MTTGRDLILLLGLAAFVAVCVALGYVFRARLAGLLTRREWILTAKLAGIAILLFVLYLVKISRAFPPEMFIYGRF